MLMILIVGAIHESPEENTLYRKMPYFVFCFRGRIVIRPYNLVHCHTFSVGTGVLDGPIPMVE